MNIPPIFNNTDFTSSINSTIKFSTPTVVYDLPKPIRSTIFSFNKVTSGVNIIEFLSDPNYLLCNCGN